jgi:hypothetical protein
VGFINQKKKKLTSPSIIDTNNHAPKPSVVIYEHYSRRLRHALPPLVTHLDSVQYGVCDTPPPLLSPHFNARVNLLWMPGFHPFFQIVRLPFHMDFIVANLVITFQHEVRSAVLLSCSSKIRLFTIFLLSLGSILLVSLPKQ